MAIVVSNVVLDTPKAKTFDLTVPEGDAIAADNAITYAAGGMSNFDGVPDLKIIENITDAAVPPSGPCHIAIPLADTLHMHIIKTAVAAGAVNHTIRVTLISRMFYEA